MAIALQCGECGRSISVRDEFAGRLITCPACRKKIPVPGGSQTAPQRVPMLHVSRRWIALAAICIAIPSVIYGYKWGPGRVQDDWNRMKGPAEIQARGVVERGLQAHLSQTGLFDPSSTHSIPRTVDFTFIFGAVCFSMPEKVGFVGTTSQGLMTGNYYPATGEVEADVELGGASLPGVGAFRRGKEKIHITGREKDNRDIVEINGQPADIVARPAF